MTKREKGIIAQSYRIWMANGPGYSVYKAYRRPSIEKRRVWNTLTWLYRDLRVTSWNCQTFSCAGFDENGLFTVITPCHKYRVSQEELLCIFREQ